MTQVSLYLFFLLKLIRNCNISVKFKKVINVLASSKLLGPYRIPVVVLKNCELEFLYILAEVANVYQGILFSRLFEGLISYSCI